MSGGHRTIRTCRSWRHGGGAVLEFNPCRVLVYVGSFLPDKVVVRNLTAIITGG